MDPQTLWIIALSIATPVAGVVGFAIQLREVKKSRLENEKLQLEIEALRAKAAAADRRIVPATQADLQRIIKEPNILYSRHAERQEIEEAPQPEPKTHLRDVVINGVIMLIIALFIAYLLYDIYRFFAWVGSWF